MHRWAARRPRRVARRRRSRRTARSRWRVNRERFHHLSVLLWPLLIPSGVRPSGLRCGALQRTIFASRARSASRDPPSIHSAMRAGDEPAARFAPHEVVCRVAGHATTHSSTDVLGTCESRGRSRPRSAVRSYRRVLCSRRGCRWHWLGAGRDGQVGRRRCCFTTRCNCRRPAHRRRRSWQWSWLGAWRYYSRGTCESRLGRRARTCRSKTKHRWTDSVAKRVLMAKPPNFCDAHSWPCFVRRTPVRVQMANRHIAAGSIRQKGDALADSWVPAADYACAQFSAVRCPGLFAPSNDVCRAGWFSCAVDASTDSVRRT